MLCPVEDIGLCRLGIARLRSALLPPRSCTCSTVGICPLGMALTTRRASSSMAPGGSTSSRVATWALRMASRIFPASKGTTSPLRLRMETGPAQVAVLFFTGIRFGTDIKKPPSSRRPLGSAGPPHGIDPFSPNLRDRWRQPATGRRSARASKGTSLHHHYIMRPFCSRHTISCVIQFAQTVSIVIQRRQKSKGFLTEPAG